MRSSVILFVLLFVHSSVFSQKIARAVNAYQDKKYEKAIDLFQDILEKEKNDLAALIGISKCILANSWLERYPTEDDRINQMNTAFPYLQQAIGVYPTYTQSDLTFIEKSFLVYGIQDLYVMCNEISSYLWNKRWLFEKPLSRLDSFLQVHGPYLTSLKSDVDRRRNELIFNELMIDPTIERLSIYLGKYPNSIYRSRVLNKLDTMSYENAIGLNTLTAYQGYLKQFSSSSLSGEIKIRYVNLLVSSIPEPSSIEAIQSVINEISKPEFKSLSVSKDAVTVLKQKVEKKEYDLAVLNNTIEAYARFLNLYPRSTYTSTIKYKQALLRYAEIESTRKYFQLPAFFAEYPTIIDFSSPFISSFIKQLSDQTDKVDITPFFNRFVDEQLGSLNETSREAVVSILRMNVDFSSVAFDTTQLKKQLFANRAVRLSSNEEFFQRLLQEMISVPDLAYRKQNGFYQNGILELYARSNGGKVRKMEVLFVDGDIVPIPQIPRMNSYFDQVRTQYSVVSATKPFISGGSGSEIQTTSYAFTTTDQKCCPSIQMILGYDYQIPGQLVPSRLVGLYRHSGQVPSMTADLTSLNWYKSGGQEEMKDIIDIPAINVEMEDDAAVKSNSDDDQIFEKVEIEASFPGGEAKWRQYLERNLSSFNPADEGAPAGTYTTYVQFVVDKEGNISDVRALTNHGYGMEEAAMRVIKKGPKWNPAIQNNRQVKAYRKQPITFRVESE